MFELWLFGGGTVFALLTGWGLNKWMHRLNPMEKYARMAKNAKKYDRKMWDDHIKQMIAENKD